MKEEIDYNSKILNFLAMTDTSDQELAVKYLEKSNWDETEAVNKFLNNFNENSNNNNDLINNNTIQNDIFNDINRSNNELITNIELNNNTNNKYRRF